MRVVDLFSQVVNKVAKTSLNGRKFRLFIIGLGTGFVSFGLTCICPDLGPYLGTLLTFITGMYATFCGSNVVATYVYGKKNPIPTNGGDQLDGTQ